MANSYIPRADARARLMLQSFASGISADAARYMLTPAEAAFIQSVVDRFTAALQIASSEATRTKVTIATKDNVRIAAEQLCRQYATLIKVNAGIADDDKIAIGVRPLNRGRRRINCPATSPLLNVIAAMPGRQILRYRDSLTPESSGKPFGAIGLQLLVAIGDERATGAAEAKLYGTFTRNPVSVAFDAADDGKVATYFARWGSRRGDVGPWSLPASMRIAA